MRLSELAKVVCSQKSRIAKPSYRHPSDNLSDIPSDLLYFVHILRFKAINVL